MATRRKYNKFEPLERLPLHEDEVRDFRVNVLFVLGLLDCCDVNMYGRGVNIVQDLPFSLISLMTTSRSSFVSGLFMLRLDYGIDYSLSYLAPDFVEYSIQNNDEIRNSDGDFFPEEMEGLIDIDMVPNLMYTKRNNLYLVQGQDVPLISCNWQSDCPADKLDVLIQNYLNFINASRNITLERVSDMIESLRNREDLTLLRKLGISLPNHQ